MKDYGGFVATQSYGPADEQPSEHQEDIRLRWTDHKPGDRTNDNIQALTDRGHLMPDEQDPQRQGSSDVEAGIRLERLMGFQAALLAYPKAVAWSTLVLFAVIMEAYDKSLLSNFYALPTFRRLFGKRVPGGGPEDYEVPSAWQIALQNGQFGGEIVGLLLNGALTDHFGYQKAMIASMCWMSLSVVVSFMAKSIGVLLLAQLLSGK